MDVAGVAPTAVENVSRPVEHNLFDVVVHQCLGKKKTRSNQSFYSYCRQLWIVIGVAPDAAGSVLL